MKWILVVLLVLFSSSAIAELTPDDLEKIGQVIDTRISSLQNWLVGLTIGMFAITGSIIIASVALLVHVHKHTSEEVDKVRDFRDEIFRRSIDHERSINENVEKIANGVEEMRQSRLEAEEKLNESQEILNEAIAHADRVFNLAGQVLNEIEPAIDKLNEASLKT